mgnify:CR=1 FL=1
MSIGGNTMDEIRVGVEDERDIHLPGDGNNPLTGRIGLSGAMFIFPVFLVVPVERNRPPARRKGRIAGDFL